MELTLLQKKLLKLLAINSRYSNKDLGKALGVSADTIHYHITKLVEQEKYVNLYVQFNYALLGYAHYHYLIRFKDPEQALPKDIISHPAITFINTSHGKYDVQLIITAKNEDELNINIRHITQSIQSNIQEVTLCKFSHMFKYSQVIPPFAVACTLPTNKKNPLYKHAKENFSHNEQGCRTLDDTDKKILKIILQQPRATYLDIGKNVKISHETARQRIHEYVESGLIANFSTSPNYKKFGYFSNYLLLRLTAVKREEITSFVESKAYIFYSAQLIGTYNLILYLTSQTPTEFGEQVKEIRSFFKNELLDIELL